jgi:hypothetical protein
MPAPACTARQQRSVRADQSSPWRQRGIAGAAPTRRPRSYINQISGQVLDGPHPARFGVQPCGAQKSHSAASSYFGSVHGRHAH